MAETPCQKCKRERDRYRKEAAELRVARENDAQRWKAAVGRVRVEADKLEAMLEDTLRAEQRAFRMALLWKRVAKKSRRLAYSWFRAATGRETGKL